MDRTGNSPYAALGGSMATTSGAILNLRYAARAYRTGDDVYARLLIADAIKGLRRSHRRMQHMMAPDQIRAYLSEMRSLIEVR